MQTLIIKDLSIAADLDSKSMAAVRGGTYGNWKMPSCVPTMPSYEHPTYPAPTSTTTVSIDQANHQCQSNPTGNGSAVFCGSIEAYNNQQAGNFIGY